MHNTHNYNKVHTGTTHRKSHSSACIDVYMHTELVKSLSIVLGVHNMQLQHGQTRCMVGTCTYFLHKFLTE